MADLKMPEVNSVIVAGRLTRDPELRYVKSDVAVCTMGLAINTRVKRGERWEDETTFLDVKAWAKQAEHASEKLRKGAPILVEGTLRQESWEAKDGSQRSKLLVVARRIHQLEWDSDRPQRAGRERKPVGEPEMSDGLPF